MEYLEEETYAHGLQSDSLPYHLDQLDQGCSEPLDGSFQPIGDGEGVDIYVLDSGLCVVVVLNSVIHGIGPFDDN